MLKRIFRRITFYIMLLIAALLAGCSFQQNTSSGSVSVFPDALQLQAHFINVGKADSILLVQGEHAMLIDGGNQADEDIVAGYIKGLGIDTLEYVIATHPHEDHIGGLTKVIRSFKIQNFILPDVTHSTQAFENMLDAAERKGLKFGKPDLPTTYSLGEASFQILAPNSSDYEQLNNYSVVCKATYREVSMLFCGDAEAVSEKEMLEKEYDLSATLLKAGHHGSNSSNTAEFLAEVQPQVVVITVDETDRTGGPGKTALQSLRETGADIYRSDEDGNIIALSDGQTLEIRTQNQIQPDKTYIPKNTAGNMAAEDPSQTEEQREFIGNKNSKKVHLPGCSGLPKEENRVYFETLEEAIAQGYSPCQICHPEEQP